MMGVLQGHAAPLGFNEICPVCNNAIPVALNLPFGLLQLWKVMI